MGHVIDTTIEVSFGIHTLPIITTTKYLIANYANNKGEHKAE